MNILICGFMGAGKTTFIDQFKNNLDGYHVFDLDGEISRSLAIESCELGAYINRHGLAHFRDLEMKMLEKLLQEGPKHLIALGGGTLENTGFWEIKGAAKLVFLDVPFEVCFERIKNDFNRPLAQKPMADIKDLYALRHSLYLRSDLVLNESQIKGIDSISSLMHNLKST